jgi:transposase-like protein
VAVPPAEEPKLKRVIEVLGNLEKRGRPRKRKTLSQAISAMFQKRISTQEVERIIAAMLARRLITEAHNAISYEF